MADPVGFVLPTIEDLDVFMSLDPAADPDDYTDTQKTWMIRSAADLMLLATNMGTPGIPVPPEDSPLGRLVKNGILDMAFYLGTSFDDRQSQQYSPYSSEKIGAYSYSRMFSSVQKKEGTGVSLFDQAVAYFNAQNSGSKDSGQFAYESEDVFKTGFRNYERDIRKESHWQRGWR